MGHDGPPQLEPRLAATVEPPTPAIDKVPRVPTFAGEGHPTTSAIEPRALGTVTGPLTPVVAARPDRDGILVGGFAVFASSTPLAFGNVELGEDGNEADACG